MGEKVSSWAFGTIFKGKDLDEGEIVAIKQITKEDIKISIENGTFKERDDPEFEYILDLEYNNIIKEANSMKKISEKIKYSCKYKDFLETEDFFYIISSYYDGDLNDILRKRKRFTPILINKIFKQLNEVFKELLKNHIVHRDIKPENILIKYNNEGYNEKINDNKINFDSILTDYSLVKRIIMKMILWKLFVERLFLWHLKFWGKINIKIIDLYSIGVTIFLLYFGKPPIKASSQSAILKKIEKRHYYIPKIEEDKDLDDLVRKLLEFNPNERITWKDYFEHPFFKKYEY